jgi:hypothetical protein
MKIAMVSESASPLAAFNGARARGQNVHVAELSAAMARRGHDVTVYTRRDDPDNPERMTVPQGYTVVHVAAGPAEYLPSGDLFGHTGEFAENLDAQWETDPPDVAHAYFWLSGLAAQLAARAQQVPIVQTFHTFGTVEQRHGGQEVNLDARLKLERLVAKNATWVVATCTDELFELIRLGRSRSRASVVPGGWTSTRFPPKVRLPTVVRISALLRSENYCPTTDSTR